jgi:hypothetical protein
VQPKRLESDKKPVDRFIVAMTEIRPLRADDLPEVVKLIDAQLPDWGGDVSFLRDTVLEHPWADEASSLVAVDDRGRLTGFIGAQVRRLRFDGQEVLGVCCSHLVVAPERRGGAAGALLIGQLLGGPQVLTWSDSATKVVAKIWRTYKGELDHTRACDWMLVLRPVGWIGSWARAAIKRDGLDRSVVPVGAFPFHTIARPEAMTAPAGVYGEDASVAEIVEKLPKLTARTRLRVDYDQSHLEHLFGVIRSRGGELICRLVRHGDRPIGWYAYLSRREAASRVLHVCAPERHVDAVLGELIGDARRRGGRVLAGRLEPHLDQALQRRLPAIGLARSPVIHARDPAVRAAVASDGALLTQLDSEWFVT